MHRSIDTVEEFWDAAALREAARRGSEPAAFADALAELLGHSRRVVLTMSGRDALSRVLRARPLPGTDRVLTPRFICPAVPGAVRHAGLEPEPYDLASPTGDYDWAAVLDAVSDRHAAVVVPHLFGVPCDLRPLRAPLSARGVALIEDCAHCVGGRLDGRAAGTFGDAAFFSFAFDKPLSLGGGGALALDPDGLFAGTNIDAGVGTATRDRIGLGLLRRFLTARRAAVRGAAPTARLQERVWGRALSRSLAHLGPIGPVRAALGLWQLDRYPDVARTRTQNATLLADAIEAPTWGVPPGVEPAWIRQKVLMPTADAARDAASALQDEGIRAGVFNWPTRALDRPRGAVLEVARCGLDVPVHQNVTAADLGQIADLLGQAYRRAHLSTTSATA